MKKISVIFVALSLACLGGCFWDDDLPEETQEGKDTFGMLVDGEKWESSIQNLLGPPKKKLYYNSDLSYIRVFAQKEFQVIDFFVENVNGEGTYFMALKNPKYDTVLCVDSTRFDSNIDTPNCMEAFKLMISSDSRVKITNFDTINQIVSGTFEAEMVNMNSEILKITDGRFDFEY